MEYRTPERIKHIFKFMGKRSSSKSVCRSVRVHAANNKVVLEKDLEKIFLQKRSEK